MTNRLALLIHWSVRQKLNRVISVQLRRRSKRALSLFWKHQCRRRHHLITVTFC